MEMNKTKEEAPETEGAREKPATELKLPNIH